jgi:hypothetical protein
MFQIPFAGIMPCAVMAIGSAMLLGCSSSHHQTSALVEPAPPSATEMTAAPQPAATPGMKAFMDPLTGEMREPTGTERAVMERQSSRLQDNQPRAMREQKLRKRGTAMTLEGDPETPLQACTSADGNVTVDHNCDQARQRSRQNKEGGSP